MNMNNNKIFYKQILKTSLIILGIIIYAIGLKWFIYGANILPAGFTGVSMLIQKLAIKYFNIEIPLTILNVGFNLLPAIYASKIIGKNFSIISFAILFGFTIVSDIIPAKTLTNEPILAAIFGGILCGFASSVWYRCGASGGGTDFIALSISSKYHIKTFEYVMAFNIILIIIQGLLFGLQPAFYSILYQYVSTQAINAFYKHYEAITILIITDKPELISKKLIEESSHSSTVFNGIGSYTQSKRFMIYTVVTQPEIRTVTSIVKKYDPVAFINTLKSNEIQGNFTYLPIDKDFMDENYLRNN